VDLPVYTNKEWLEDQYVTQGKTIAQVAATAGCTHMTIQRWMRHHDIQSRRSGQRSSMPIQAEVDGERVQS